MKYQAIFFDFDYTLGDATDSIYEGFCYAFRQMGWPQPQREAVRRTVGYMLEDAYTLLTGEADPARQAEFRRWFQEKVVPTQAEKTRLLPGAVDLLTRLHAEGVKLGVVTSKRTDTLRAILERRGVLDKMDYTVGGDKVSKPKPDPEGLNGAIAALGVDKSAVLYCGDTVIDAGTARAAGVDFAAVLQGTTPAGAFADYPSVHIAPDLAELDAWLANNERA